MIAVKTIKRSRISDGARRCSSRRADTDSAAMDELTAAAAVFAMDNDSDAGEEMALEASGVEVCGDDCEPSTSSSTPGNKEDDHDAPAAGDIEAANSKVSKRPLAQQNPARAQPEASWPHPVFLLTV